MSKTFYQTPKISRILRRAAAVSVMAIAMISAPAAYATPRWEAPKTERSDTKTVAKEGDVEIRAARGVVQVNTPRPIQIKIYTILGRLVSQDTVGPGTFQFQVSTHGVYIVKIGQLTCKVAI